MKPFTNSFIPMKEKNKNFRNIFVIERNQKEFLGEAEKREIPVFQTEGQFLKDQDL
jgi:hypothetical protein